MLRANRTESGFDIPSTTPDCLNCKHRQGIQCNVFPGGIPEHVRDRWYNNGERSCGGFEYEALVVKYNWFRVVFVGAFYLLIFWSCLFDSEHVGLTAITLLLFALIWYESELYGAKKDRAYFANAWRNCTLLLQEQKEQLRKIEKDKKT